MKRIPRTEEEKKGKALAAIIQREELYMKFFQNGQIKTEMLLAFFEKLTKNFSQLNKPVRENIDYAITPRNIVVTDTLHVSLTGVDKINQEFVRYSSPEVLDKEMSEKINHRSDIYTLGIICFEFLTGRLPFDIVETIPFYEDREKKFLEESKRDIIRMHFTQLPVFPLYAEIPDIVQRIVMCMLEKTPDERYQTFYAIVRDLEECRRLLTMKGQASSFQIGLYDKMNVRPHWEFSDKVYGRQAEVELLTRLFRNFRRRNTNNVATIIGGSGMGKTNLSNWFCKNVIEMEKVESSDDFYIISTKVWKGQKGTIVSALVDLLHKIERKGKLAVQKLQKAVHSRLSRLQVVAMIEILPKLQDLIQVDFNENEMISQSVMFENSQRGYTWFLHNSLPSVSACEADLVDLDYLPRTKSADSLLPNSNSFSDADLGGYRLEYYTQNDSIYGNDINNSKQTIDNERMSRNNPIFLERLESEDSLMDLKRSLSHDLNISNSTTRSPSPERRGFDRDMERRSFSMAPMIPSERARKKEKSSPEQLPRRSESLGLQRGSSRRRYEVKRFNDVFSSDSSSSYTRTFLTGNYVRKQLVAFEQFMKAIAEIAKLVVHIDDAHLLDQVERERLEIILKTPGLSMFLLLSRRNLPQSSVIQGYFNKVMTFPEIEKSKTIVLGGLKPVDVRQMLCDYFEKHYGPPPKDLPKIIAYECLGNPYIIENTVDGLVDGLKRTGDWVEAYEIVKETFPRFSRQEEAKDLAAYQKKQMDVRKENILKLDPFHRKVLDAAKLCPNSIIVDIIGMFLGHKNLNDIEKSLNYLEAMGLLSKNENNRYQIAHEEVQNILDDIYKEGREKKPMAAMWNYLKLGNVILNAYRQKSKMRHGVTVDIEDVVYCFNHCEKLVTEVDIRILVATFNYMMATKYMVEQRIKLAIRFLEKGNMFLSGRVINYEYEGEEKKNPKTEVMEKFGSKTHDLAFSIGKVMGLLYFLDGRFDDTVKVLDELEVNIRPNTADLVELVLMRVFIEVGRQDYKKAMAVGQEGLREMEVFEYFQEYEDVNKILERLKKEKGGVLGVFESRKKPTFKAKMALRLLVGLIPVSHLLMERTNVRVICTMTLLLLKYGFEPEAVQALVFFSGLLVEIGEYQEAVKISRAAIEYAERNDVASLLPQIYEFATHCVLFFAEDVWKFLQPLSNNAFNYGVVCGSFDWAAYSKLTLAWESLVFKQCDLRTCLILAKNGWNYSLTAKNLNCCHNATILIMTIENLMSKEKRTRFDLSEKEFLLYLQSPFEENKAVSPKEEDLVKTFDGQSKTHFQIVKIWVFIIMGEISIAYELVLEVRKNVSVIYGWAGALFMYLDLLTSYIVEKDSFEEMEEKYKNFKKFSNSPTFKVKHLILKAERERYLKKRRIIKNNLKFGMGTTLIGKQHSYKSYDLYERAIVMGQDCNFIQDAAFAAHRAAEMNGSTRQSLELVDWCRDASETLYKKWGCYQKVFRIQKERVEVISQSQENSFTEKEEWLMSNIQSLLGSFYSILDFEQLVKVLLIKLPKITRATRATLVFQVSGRPEIFGQTVMKQSKYEYRKINQGLNDQRNLFPVQIYNHVSFTKELYVLTEGLNEIHYFIGKKTKCAVAFPILESHTNCLGVILLENDVLRNVFTSKILELIRFIIPVLGVCFSRSLVVKRSEFVNKSSDVLLEGNYSPIRKIDIEESLYYLTKNTSFYDCNSKKECRLLLEEHSWILSGFIKRIHNVMMNKGFRKLFVIPDNYPGNQLDENSLNDVEMVKEFLIKCVFGEKDEVEKHSYVWSKEVKLRWVFLRDEKAVILTVVELSLKKEVEKLHKRVDAQSTDTRYMFHENRLRDNIGEIHNEKMKLMVAINKVVSTMKKETTELDIIADIGSLNHDQDIEELIVYSDPEKINICLLNIIENSIKFSDEESKNIIIFCNILQETKTHYLVQIEIQDEGIGLDHHLAEGKVEDLFKLFTQGDGIREKYGGEGYGLAYSRIISEMLGGKLFFGDNHGMRGAMIVLELNLEKYTNQEEDLYESPISIYRHASNMRGMESNSLVFPFQNLHVLVIDDSLIVRSFIEKILRNVNEDFKLSSVISSHFSRGEDGIQFYKEKVGKLSKKKRINMILIDIQLPGMDGHTTCEMFRKVLKFDGPIFAISATTSTKKLIKSKEVHFDEFLPKPLSVEAFVSAVNRYYKKKYGESPENKKKKKKKKRTTPPKKYLQ